MSTRSGTLVAAAAALLLTGCMHAARVFLDLDELAETHVPQTPAGPPEGYALVAELPELPPPPIESVTDSDSLLALLPADASGGIDWVAAGREGIIRPRPGTASPEDTLGGFGYDLYLHTGEGPEAYFPHSVHRDWLSCTSCHPKVYRNGKGSYSRETAHDASSCSFCHGSVAFPIRSCERCHEAAADLPQARVAKSLGLPMQLERVDSTDWSPERRRTGREDLDLVTAYPPATFPHGPHRIRYQCRACHEWPFPMEQGATVLTEEDAHGGAGCGACHDGVTAFEAGGDTCYQCHVGTTDPGGAPEP